MIERIAILFTCVCLATCGSRVRESGPGQPDPGPAAVIGAADEPPPVDRETDRMPAPAPVAASDGDADTILDKDDLCPLDPEDMDSFEDLDGCPDPDNDQDAIPDTTDKCPNEPETYNGTLDEDGCPDNSKVVVISCPHPKPQELVLFKKGTAKIAKQSIAILDAVVQVIESNPQVLRVQVAAHADEKGNKKKNIALAKKRAQAVVDHLLDKGVPQGVFSAAGYGSICPVAKHKKRAAEFFLLETDAGCVDAQFACDKAIDLGLVPEEDEKYLPESDYCEGLSPLP